VEHQRSCVLSAGRLSKLDVWLVGQLFFGDRTEAAIATQIGITQQAVSERKWMILIRLRRCMIGTSLSTKKRLFTRIDKWKPTTYQT
jgi:hypothetical protein